MKKNLITTRYFLPFTQIILGYYQFINLGCFFKIDLGHNTFFYFFIVAASILSFILFFSNTKPFRESTKQEKILRIIELFASVFFLLSVGFNSLT